MPRTRSSWNWKNKVLQKRKQFCALCTVGERAENSTLDAVSAVSWVQRKRKLKLKSIRNDRTDVGKWWWTPEGNEP